MRRKIALSKDEIMRVASTMSADEQEAFLSSLGEEKLLAEYGEKYMLRAFEKVNNKRMEEKYRRIHGSEIIVRTVWDGENPYCLVLVKK